MKAAPRIETSNPYAYLTLLAYCSLLPLSDVGNRVFSLYGCELFEPRDDPDDPPAGNTDELILAWVLSAFQRFVRQLVDVKLIPHLTGLWCHLSAETLFASISCSGALTQGATLHLLLQVLHEPTLILAAKGLRVRSPTLFATSG